LEEKRSHTLTRNSNLTYDCQCQQEKKERSCEIPFVVDKSKEKTKGSSCSTLRTPLNQNKSHETGSVGLFLRGEGGDKICHLNSACKEGHAEQGRNAIDRHKRNRGGQGKDKKKNPPAKGSHYIINDSLPNPEQEMTEGIWGKIGVDGG